MKSIALITVTLACIVLAGCESKQAKLDKLQAEYKVASKRHFDDCIAPIYGGAGADAYFKGEKPKVLTPQEKVAQQQKEAEQQQKCAQELDQVAGIQKQIEAVAK